MNGPIDSTIGQKPGNSMPAFLGAITRPVSLLPGEDIKEFNAIRDTILNEIAPRSAVEWLWTLDLVELSWDIQRYRTLRHKVLEAHRVRAVEQLLIRLDSACIPAKSQEKAERESQRNAQQWRDDPTAAVEIEARLACYGFDASSIDMEVIVQAREIFILFDNLMHSAQNRRIVVLRELNGRRLASKEVRNIRRVISDG